MNARLCAGLGAAVVAGLFACEAAAADRLTTTGARLAPEVVADLAHARIQRVVELDGDVPTATYVIAKDNTNKLLQRTNDGYWIPWDSKRDSLVDNKLVPQSDKLTYKVLAEDISKAMFPLSITLAYKVGSDFKYGVFPVEAAE